MKLFEMFGDGHVGALSNRGPHPDRSTNQVPLLPEKAFESGSLAEKR
jgi:hypothetical protein